MKRISQLLTYFFVTSSLFAQPISLHPENPHYFLFRGKAAVIVSSSEHYGAVINPAFDFLRYLSTLQKEDMNYTRLISDSYFEKEGSFGIEKNTLAPSSGVAILPWKRSNEPGALCGGNKFDLNQWDEKYFAQLKAFVSEAGKRVIVVGVTLFSSIHGYWDIKVWNPNNNITITEGIQRQDLQTLNNGNKYNLKLNLPEGNYLSECINTLNGSVIKSENIKHTGGIIKLTSPEYSEDLAL